MRACCFTARICCRHTLEKQPSTGQWFLGRWNVAPRKFSLDASLAELPKGRCELLVAAMPTMEPQLSRPNSERRGHESSRNRSGITNGSLSVSVGPDENDGVDRRRAELVFGAPNYQELEVRQSKGPPEHKYFICYKRGAKLHLNLYRSFQVCFRIKQFHEMRQASVTSLRKIPRTRSASLGHGMVI